MSAAPTPTIVRPGSLPLHLGYDALQPTMPSPTSVITPTPPSNRQLGYGTTTWARGASRILISIHIHVLAIKDSYGLSEASVIIAEFTASQSSLSSESPFPPLLHSHADTHTHTHLVCTCMSIHTHTSMSSTRLFYSMSCSWAISTSPSQVLVSVNSDLDGFHLRCPILALLRCPLQLASELALLCSHSSQLSNSLVQMGLNALFLLLSSCWSLHFIRHSFVWSLDSVFWRSSVLAEVALLEFVSDFLPFVPWQGRQALNDDSKDGEVQ